METKKLNIIFTQGFNSNNLITTIVRNIIKWFTKSKFDHCELLFRGELGTGIKYNSKTLPHHTTFLSANVLYSSSFTKHGHELITFNKRIVQLKKHLTFNF